jgi:DNA transformation protein and related proteins
MSELTKIPNIGPELAKRLEAIGVNSYDQLARLGTIETVKRLKLANINACCNMLYAIEGAIRKIRWHDLPKQDREKLKEEYKRKILD